MDKKIARGHNNIERKKKICEKFFKKLLTKAFDCGIIADVNGASPSGKATDSDSVIT